MITNLNAGEGEIIWRSDDRPINAPNTERFAEFVRGRGIPLEEGYRALWEWSVSEPDSFWAEFIDFAGIQLGGVAGPVRNGVAMPNTRWFPGRTLNFAQHLLEGREGVALVAVAEGEEPREVTFTDLRGQVGALAARLRALGVEPGDRVVAVLPNVPAAVVALLATVSIGAIWSVCSPEFGPGAITSRFNQLQPKVVIAAPGYRLAGEDRDRSAETAEVIATLPSVEHVIWVTGHATAVTPAALAVSSSFWDDVVREPAAPVYESVDFSHPLWVLFSSGTTGIPKGIVHGHGGALLEEMKLLLFGGDVQPGDRFFSVASTSWVVWNTLISAIGVGAVAVLADGNPTYPSLDRVWEVVAQTGTAVLGVGASFVHACAKTNLEPSRQHDLSALRTVQVTGSPLSVDGFRWIYQHVGDVWLASMSGGTDIVGCFVGGAVTEPVRVGYIQVPALGVCVESWDTEGAPTQGKGELVVTAPMPSMPLYLWGDEDGSRYRASYFDTYPGVWRHGDFIEIGDRGIRILGRSDSTLNRNGIRLGSADIYAVVESLPEIAEAMVIGAEIGDEGYYMPLFVRLQEGVRESDARAAVVAAIRNQLSARYLPDEFVVMRGIPHTRTGKKLEVPVKRLIQGCELSEVVEIGSVDDPDVLREYAAFAAQKQSGLARR
ncbi:acetoacetate--CoA ligase [Leucobacter sp. Z1108]|uniref:acetoacetate--CoA ligase n=1 Tax=Leucobacter sp. Z1108 TaxID=3439066 RepID=UPI003F35F681